MSQVVDLSKNLRIIESLLLVLRNEKSDKIQFVNASRRLMNLICEEGLSYLPTPTITVHTPTGIDVSGKSLELGQNVIAVSIIRAGDSMLDVFLSTCPHAQVGKILIQRNEETTEPVLYYSKLPSSEYLSEKQIVILDPMLATGGSVCEAIRVLLEKGAKEENISFFNVIACPQGIEKLNKTYPKIKVITGKIDETLNAKAYIIPGLGDFGDRYFGTI